jgi:anthranilate synthase
MTSIMQTHPFVLFSILLSSNILRTSNAFIPSLFGSKREPFFPYSSSIDDVVSVATTPDFNSVPVAKEGGRGVATASQQAAAQGLSLGAPPVRPEGGSHLTEGGIEVTAHVQRLTFSDPTSTTVDRTDLSTSDGALEDLVNKLDSRKGVLLQSSYEFPGRYARWSLGFVDPPLEVAGRGLDCKIAALNDRGKVLLPAIQRAMEQLKQGGILQTVELPDQNTIQTKVVPPPEVGSFSEEDRSRQPSLFSVVRALVDLFGYKGGDRQLGLYGAFGYDLTFQFEPIELKQDRDGQQRDLLLYLPDDIVVVDQDKRDAWRVSYDFQIDQKSTLGMERTGSVDDFQPFDEETTEFVPRDTPKNEFANSVERAKREFAVGNLFEAVLSQTFREKLNEERPPSVLFRRLRARNPAPYGFFINLGEQEYLVGASPEMFVRCEAISENDYRPGAIRVETCPISGTVARGADALEDAQRVKSLMMNAKEESELTMCTDVDRNDKSRICEPGSVQVIGRRQIEMYSRLIHTVDHVEGYLRPEFDALDAFLCHTWAVTVTGAPKTWAIQFVEDQERSPRCWYGGAVGVVGFDGGMNTGLTLRTVRVKNGVAEVRAGATLLYDSSPPAEELETELKASAMIDAIVQTGPEDDSGFQIGKQKMMKKPVKVGKGKSIILIDHEDSFVHTLGNYLRQTGAKVSTLRSGPSALTTIESLVKKGEKPDLVVLSPGPGNPSDFKLATTIEFLLEHKIPAFGVCLGLQGMVEYFGGKLGVLGYPMHGKPSPVSLTHSGKSENSILAGLPDSFEVARYHSLFGIKEKMPSCLDVTALSDDGIVMGIQHKSLPYAAVQFHPESILTSPAHGINILENVISVLQYEREET